MGLFGKKSAKSVAVKYDDEKAVQVGWVLNEYAPQVRQVADRATWNDETRRTDPMAATFSAEKDPRGNLSVAVRVNKIPIGFLSSTVNSKLLPIVKRGPVPASVILHIEGQDRLCARACAASWL